MALAGAQRPSYHSSKLLCGRLLLSGCAFTIPPNWAQLDGCAVALFRWAWPDDGAGTLFRLALPNGRVASRDDGAGAFFRLTPPDNNAAAFFR